MKKIFVIGLGIFLLGAGSVAATSGTDSSKLNQKIEFKELRKQTKEEFRAKLQTIKDERKKTAVSNLNNRLCEVQKKRVEAMNKSVEAMASVSARLNEKLDGASNQYLNKANSAQAEAKSALASLAVRSCGISISGDETKLRSEYKVAVEALEKEVKAVKAKIQIAREATRIAVVDIMQKSEEVTN